MWYNGIMRGILKFILVVAGNALALWLAWLYVPGFVLNTSDWVQLGLLALVLALLNGLLKPILKLIFGPIIILTLGIGLLVINGFILYLLPIIVNYIDFLRGSIMIQDIPALVYATLIFTVINFVVHLAA
jgi:putative membrane protein